MSKDKQTLEDVINEDFYDDNSCGGWHTLTNPKDLASAIKDFIRENLPKSFYVRGVLGEMMRADEVRQALLGEEK